MTIPPKDPDHWLHRLAPAEWLVVAVRELEEADRARAARQQRPLVASARRAAGMALNAVLCVRPDESWGRSYMEHVRALERVEGLPAQVAAAARTLREASLEAPKLVRIGGATDQGVVPAAAEIVEWARAQVVDALAGESQG